MCQCYMMVGWRICGASDAAGLPSGDGSPHSHRCPLAPPAPRSACASLPRCLAASLPRCLAASLPRCLAASLPRCLAASLPRCLAAALPTGKATPPGISTRNHFILNHLRLLFGIHEIRVTYFGRRGFPLCGAKCDGKPSRAEAAGVCLATREITFPPLILSKSLNLIRFPFPPPFPPPAIRRTHETNCMYFIAPVLRIRSPWHKSGNAETPG
jgi:hypothetical protein